jgi:NTP pyrophosphatase (non-canonical NTP hydrolase)
MNLEILSKANAERMKVTPAYQKCREEWNLADWSNALAGETGELCNIVKKIRRGDDIDVKDAGKELADIVIYADLLATQLGLDLSECIVQKFNEVSDRVHSSIKIDKN